MKTKAIRDFGRPVSLCMISRFSASQMTVLLEAQSSYWLEVVAQVPTRGRFQGQNSTNAPSICAEDSSDDLGFAKNHGNHCSCCYVMARNT